ncbi:hypothetical protein J7T55_010919 [Diaporthe amygdali]|uniref:uncharacterized protein n=1 Tax=Phomopsis amygdali TaxID=1214568 RepID=UPI0022FEC343|nr:uncharacterized protein J7T55_010919 [Diaporthe amygdali]KAJ0104453.1 hypothetical protein J7T55_010919 [Diaporthe amygdali]
MFSRTSLTIRVSGISPETESTESLKERCREFTDLKPKKTFFRTRHETQLRPLLVSLARHGDSDMGTVTFPSQGSKKRALDSLTLAGWKVDDTFADLTVLHSAPEPDLEYGPHLALLSSYIPFQPGKYAQLGIMLTRISICAVHGLNGNAFDTFAWEGREMWLRDFLPESRPFHPEFSRARIMTYGYSSLLRDNKNTTGLDEWSLGLLQSVSAARRSPSVI